jgi:hypothetical protein
MPVKSLKNLDSFSRGYIEGRTTKVDFDTTLSGDIKTAVTSGVNITFTSKLSKNEGSHDEVIPRIGQLVSGKDIVGLPKVTAFILDNGNGESEITIDTPQTLDANTYLTISDTNSGLDKFNIVGSTLSRTKEDIRTNNLVPEELLSYAGNVDSGGMQVFLDAYYKFMNTEEFLYKEIEEFEDVVINNVATIRIPNPNNKDTKFFSQRGARASQIIDSDGNILTVGPNASEYDIAEDEINIFNVDNLPSEISLDNNSGRTLSIVGLPARLNNKKITVRTSVQNLVISNPSFKINTLEDALNINETDEALLDMMQREIAPAVDKNIKVNKRALYQRLIDFYRIRGSKDSVDLFFKLFFQDEEIKVDYPWDSTLKTSAGNWDNQTLVAATYDKLSNNITASDVASGDEFGSSISLDNVVKMIAVGAPGETSDEGAVYIYNSINGGQNYNTEKKLVSATGASGDNFGKVVSLSDEVVAISAPNDTDYTGGTAANSGTVEIWQRFLTTPGGNPDYTWTFQAKLKGNSGGLNFGTDISLQKDTLAVAVPGYVNAGKSNGAVIIYKGTGASWVESQVISTPIQLNEGGNNGFADKVILKGNYLLVSWTGKSSNSGSVCIFSKNLSTGLFTEIPEAILTPDTLSNNDLFGSSIDIDVSTAPANPVCAISSPGSRSVYVFQRNVASNNTIQWDLQDRLQPLSGQSNDGFGTSINIFNNNVIVGAPLSDGLDSTNPVTNCGVIYHFENTDQWVQKATYEEVKTANNKFGSFIEISNAATYNLLIGTPHSSGGGHIVNFLRPSQSGKYLDNQGFLSDKQKIQDSEFYQKFSYVIKAGRNISQWKDTYNKLVHPAGFKYFGEILVIIKAVRESLGDGAGPLGPRTTIVERTRDIFGNEITEERDLIAYSNAAAFRKTFSSMPGVQPGLVRDDLALLVIALASFFSSVSDARPNRSSRLSIVKLETGGAIPADGVSIVEPGAGYNTAPTVTASDGSGAVFETEVNRFGEVVDVIVKGGHPLTVSTPTSSTAFVFNGSADNSRTTGNKTGKSTGGSRSSGSGINGQVTIVVANDKTIESVTPTTAGTGYKVGEVITIPGSDLGGGADLLLTVNQVHSGTGYDANSSLTVQSLSQVPNSGLETAIGKVTDLTEITVASNPLTAGLFYKILDLGNATFANFNTISTEGYDRETWEVGDIFQAATTGSGLTTTAKLQIAEIGLTVNLDLTKKYRIPPNIKIGAPDAIDSLGRALTTNVNTEARLTLNTEIPLDGTARLALMNRYIIAFKGNATDANFNAIAKDQQTTWNVGDTFIAYNDGSVLSSTTATVVLYEAEGRLNGFSITNAGLGYINDPEVKIVSNSIHEKRVPTVIPIKIVTNGNDIQHISEISGRVTTTNIDRNNNYFKRKIYNQNPILGVKKFTGEYRIDQLGSFNIENVDTTTINNFNVNTIIQPEKDRSS